MKRKWNKKKSKNDKLRGNDKKRSFIKMWQKEVMRMNEGS